MGDFRTLTAWQKAMDLLDAIYLTVRTFPPTETYCLSLQMRKAAVSIPSNLAEGRGRYTVADQRHFYVEARGSTHELETQIEASTRQHFIAGDQGQQLINQTQEVCKLISGLIRKLDGTQGLGPKA
jgi:four helix bundle protein